MRRQAKASTAGSTQRQATGLGRFFRGADAGRWASPHSGGSGAPSRGRVRFAPARGRRLAGLAALALVSLLALNASAALAAESEPAENYARFGPDGTEGSDFERIGGVGVDQNTGDVYVLDSTAGALYKFEADGQPLPWGGSAGYISGNEITGLAPFTSEGRAQVAVDSSSHVVYVTEQGSVRAFQADGEEAEFTAGPGIGTSEIPAAGETVGVAVDVNGAIYVSENGGTVKVYAADGEPLSSFTAPAPLRNVGVSSEGDVYVSVANKSASVPRLYAPTEFPVTSSTAYVPGVKLKGITSFSQFSGVNVDPATGEIFVLEQYVFGDAWISQFDKSGTLRRTYGVSAYFGGLSPEDIGPELKGASQGIATVVGDGEFQFYIGHNDSGAGTSKVEIFGEEVIEGPPAIVGTSSAAVSADAATLGARINPNTAQTTYHFEFGLGDCAVSACSSAPVGGRQIAAGHKPTRVTQPIAGLEAGATYHYRVVAENSFGTTEGPDHTFTTQLRGLGFQLPDGRVWELVSPPDKPNGGLEVKPNTLVQAAASGDAIKYVSRGSFEAGPEGNRTPEFSSNLARRSPSGAWPFKDITTPNDESAGATGSDQYWLMSSDLSHSLLVPTSDVPLSADATEFTPYIRTNTDPPGYTPLINEANVTSGLPWGGDLSKYIILSAANANLSDVTFAAGAPLLAGASSAAIYHWRAGQLEVVNELPTDEGGEIVAGQVGSGFGSIRHAISEDGSRIFWAPSFYYYGLNQPALYVRDTVADETIRLDVVQPGGSGTTTPGGGGQTADEKGVAFQAATPDGSVVYFTDGTQLTADASPSGRDLYRCELGADTSQGCVSLTDLSAPGAGSADVVGMTPSVSDDGSRAYFVANGVLDSAPNGHGDTATAGQPNLYLWEEGQGVRFIATLAPDSENKGVGDSPVWGRGEGHLAYMSAYGSPSGRFLTFTSQRSLTGYENLAPGSALPNQEVFVYDALTDRLDCASCIPTGAGAVGTFQPRLQTPAPIDIQDLWAKRQIAATLPMASDPRGLGDTVFHQPRVAFDSGRVFFNAIDSLVPADTNGEWDVYEYEPLGAGSCTASVDSSATARSGAGCVSLISSGRAEGESAFLEASATGGDAFVLTRGRLSVLDEDVELDVYDARVGGVAATRTPSAECLGEACQPAAVAPNDPTPASAGFRGQGNVRPAARKRCAKSKRAVKKNGKSRCVRRKRCAKSKRAVKKNGKSRCVRRKHKAKAKRAGTSGRASR